MPQSNETAVRKPRLVGMNHVALEVGDIEEALAFYGRIFQFTLRGKGRNNAFIGGPVRDLVVAAGGELLDGPFLDFLDPWGNRVEVVAYSDIQYTKAPHVLRGMGFGPEEIMQKTEKAHRELADKGMAPEPA